MKFTFLSLFPSLISGYFSDSILKRAQEAGLIDIEIIDFRDFSTDKHKKVDNYQASGGAGLVICADILESALHQIATPQSHIIYLTPVAKPFCNFVINGAKFCMWLLSCIFILLNLQNFQ